MMSYDTNTKQCYGSMFKIVFHQTPAVLLGPAEATDGCFDESLLQGMTKLEIHSSGKGRSSSKELMIVASTVHGHVEQTFLLFSAYMTNPFPLARTLIFSNSIPCCFW